MIEDYEPSTGFGKDVTIQYVGMLRSHRWTIREGV